MAERIFQEILAEQNSNQRGVCVGLDTAVTEVDKRITAGLKLPLRAHATAAERVLAYNNMVIAVTREFAACYKPNRAFYEPLGPQGVTTLRRTFQLIRDMAPHTVGIFDAKYGDIGTTNEPYAQFAFAYLKADAVTIHGYLGKEAMQPFLDWANKGIFVLARTSNPGAGEFQDLKVPQTAEQAQELANELNDSKANSENSTPQPQAPKLYEQVALQVAHYWNKNGNCGLVAGATYPEEAKQIRAHVGPKIPLLIPGVGAQGQTADEIVPVALRLDDLGIINSSRGIIFAKPKEGEKFEDAIYRAARDLHNEIVTAQLKVA